MSTTNALTINQYLKYSNIQMAAEAFIRNPKTDLLSGEGDALARALIDGNKHNSVFTKSQAENFAAHWVALDQLANTTTGFSGSVFKCIKDDPATGAKAGELVLSLRSTEFIDDAARDNQATNSMEIREFGFAFGQIRDMMDWYSRLNQPGGALAGQSFAVTGYSLGGHLASVLNRLDGGNTRMKEVVTFNGAGIGAWDPQTKLGAIIDRFTELAANTGGVAFNGLFTDLVVRELYVRANEAIAFGGNLSADDTTLLNSLSNSAVADGAGALIKDQASTLARAIGRVNTIRAEVARLAGLASGDGSSPTAVPNTAIAQQELDYQLAVLTMGKSTDATSLLGSAIRTFRGKEYLPGILTNQYDVTGATSPSAVSNSQWHIGHDAPIFIEDQPLFRGTIISDTVLNSLKYGDVKLLNNGYANADFGDTHSLALLVDSLSVQNVVLSLLPATDRATGGAALQLALQQASYLKPENGSSSSQGKAEGDVLENLLNAVVDLVLGPDHKRLKGSPDGNTWAKMDDFGDYTGRASLHALIQSITESAIYKQVADGNLILKLTSVTSGLADQARSDFGAFMTLKSLSPLALLATTDAARAALQAAAGPAWGALYTQWQADKVLFTSGQASTGLYNISQEWLRDRADFLARKDWFNAENHDPLKRSSEVGDGSGARYASDNTYFEDVASKYRIAQGFAPEAPLASTQRYYFGDDANNTYTGGTAEDHLYGGNGNDTLNGLAGDDYLEGNAGDDKLDGGKGNDTLRGGAGTDGYNFASGWGEDTIEDSDGLGRITVEGIGLLSGTGAKKIDANAINPSWRSADKKVVYTVVKLGDAASDTRRDLYITFTDKPDVIRVRNWKDSNLGLSFGDELTPPTGTPVPGDSVKQVLNGTIADEILRGWATNDGLSGGQAPNAKNRTNGRVRVMNCASKRGHRTQKCAGVGSVRRTNTANYLRPDVAGLSCLLVA
jgi:RTX calcium-binding nonapeptide repeat (4 copies)